MTSDFLIKIAADYCIAPIVLIGAYALLFKVPKASRWQSYGRILLAGLTAYLFAKIIGSYYQPSLARPFELANQAAKASFLNNPGFPSDHALFISAITLAVWFETRQKMLTIILALFVIIVCVGRVLALVHSPADVIGGAVIALFGAVWYLILSSCKTRV